jgi:hypothetical protein
VIRELRGTSLFNKHSTTNYASDYGFSTLTFWYENGWSEKDTHRIEREGKGGVYWYWMK